MRECERELIRVIRESADPAKTIAMVEDIMRRLIAGEDEQSIAASYGIKLQEVIHAADRQWLDAMCLVGRNVADHIKSLYEKEGDKVFAIEPLKPKRVVELTRCVDQAIADERKNRGMG